MGEGTLAINATKGYLVQLREFATIISCGIRRGGLTCMCFCVCYVASPDDTFVASEPFSECIVT